MAAAWDISDNTLNQMLSAFIDGYLQVTDLRFKLYKNDYTPVPGSADTDYTEADFPGYTYSELVGGHWGVPAVTDHVAITQADETLVYTADAGAWSPQIIFGYFVVDGDDHYFWGERFGSPRTIAPSDILQLTPEFRQRTYPYA